MAVQDSERPYSFSRLRDLFKEAYEADEYSFREMRTSIRMYAGEHFTRSFDQGVGGEIARFSRGSRGTGINRIRIVKNHCPRVADVYVNQIMSSVPDVEVVGINSQDPRAQRVADLNNQVLEEDKRRTKKYKQRLREKALYFVSIGEVAIKLYWDEEKDWVTRQMILPFDLLRAPGIKNLDDSPWLIHRNVFTTEELTRIYGEEWVQRNMGDNRNPSDDVGEVEFPAHTVFDTQKREFQELRGLEIREFYLRPNSEYPEGYFCFFTSRGIIEEGPLPGGVFPIVTARCLTTPSVARGYSPFKILYPLQQEINRASGQDASNNIHFGDDKLISGAHSKIQLGNKVEGMSHIKVNQYGGKITDAYQIIEGKGQPKNIDYVMSLIKEIDYQLNIETLMQEKKGPKAGDISYVFFSTIKDQQKFSSVAQCFEEFLKEENETALKLFRHYLDEGDLIHDSNRQDYIVISDFKETDEEDYLIETKVRNNTPTELLGRHMQVRDILQYVGAHLDRRDIGHLLKDTVLGDSEALISHFTQGEEACTQNLIALEKGQFPIYSETEDFAYKAEKITARMNRPDFPLLPQPIQENFRRFLKLCEEMVAKAAQEKMRLEKGIIPSSGYLVNTDFYITIPGAKGDPVTKKAKFPSHALEWLGKALEKQGTMLESIEPLSAPSQGRIGNILQGGEQQSALTPLMLGG